MSTKEMYLTKLQVSIAAANMDFPILVAPSGS